MNDKRDKLGTPDNLVQVRGACVQLCYNEVVKDYNVAVCIELHDGNFYWLALTPEIAKSLSISMSNKADVANDKLKQVMQ